MTSPSLMSATASAALRTRRGGYEEVGASGDDEVDDDAKIDASPSSMRPTRCERSTARRRVLAALLAMAPLGRDAFLSRNLLSVDSAMSKERTGLRLQSLFLIFHKKMQGKTKKKRKEKLVSALSSVSSLSTLSLSFRNQQRPPRPRTCP